ncbi:MAG: hypothetical protein IBJ11_11980 [Phycisphaerales bacterium]|nr:hypothetical protein [Phycisphaerales bacterium]
MASRVSTGFTLMKESWGVLRRDKQLLLLPLISGLTCLAIAASFLIPAGLVMSALRRGRGDEAGPLQPLIWLAMVLAFYLVAFFTVTFFNSALVAGAIERLRGGEPTLRSCLAAATGRLPQIARWAAVGATVGWTLHALQSRAQLGGRIGLGVAGAGWSAVTYFVVPVLVVEGVGPIEAIKRSALAVKKTWGEALTANIGLGALGLVIGIACMLPIVLGVAGSVTLFARSGPGSTETVPLVALVAGVGVTAALLVVYALVVSALKGILSAALYLYARDGVAPAGFDAATLRGAFSAKPG